MGIIDGDCKDTECDFLIKLPGDQPPEIIVVSSVCENFDTLSNMITKPKKEIIQAFESAKTCSDYHEWITKMCYELGEDPDHLWIIFTRIWCQKNPAIAEDFFRKFVDQFEKLIKK